MPNRLASATSPYLLQHKDNPVQWHEWGEEAFEEARERDVPILLSVGYAACHWCHVMAHESFEDTDTAALMNERFVNVKVDREERPDVDTVYMEAVQAMTGQGGWPMTVWLDHQARPFFAGTYFPKQGHHGLPSFVQVMDAVWSAWAERREDVSGQAARLVEAMSREIPPGDLPDESSLASAYQKIASNFDPVHGGFGQAPKFPQQPILEFLLRVHRESWAADADSMLTKTLGEMATGGIHDQIGGGFARYSVDANWLVPHFEKMLYDNAQLTRLYLWAGLEFDRNDFIDVARATIDYLERDLRHPGGGFYSSEDADSEGEEGKFYVWTPEELETVLGDRAEEIVEYYGVTATGNFEGRNILSVVGDERPQALQRARAELLEARSSKRVRPGLDDKVIASWNGLAIRALAETGAALDEEHHLVLAREAADFILSNLVVEGQMMRSWRDGKTSVPGFLEDHSSMAVALFALFAATGEGRWYEEAMALVDAFDDFARPDGGFYSTSAATGDLVKRPSDLTDNPLPSGNSLAAEALLAAYLYTGDHVWLERAVAAVELVGLLADRYPSMVGHHLAVAHSLLDPRELAIVGADWKELASVYWSRYRPGVALAPSADGSSRVPLLNGRTADNGAKAYVCRGFVCDLPTSDPQRLAEQLA